MLPSALAVGIWEDRCLPRLIDWGMDSRGMHKQRRLALAEARGRVLEVGFGSGLNLPWYPEGVHSLVAIEPSARALAMAAARIAAAPFSVEPLELEGERIGAADESFDTVVSTFTLCTIADVSVALAQMRRVLRPSGRFIFLEHGRSEEPGVHRWQRRWNPAQKWLFGGCHVDREIDRLVQDAGFVFDRLDRYHAKGPKLFTAFYRGVARKAD